MTFSDFAIPFLIFIDLLIILLPVGYLLWRFLDDG